MNKSESIVTRFSDMYDDGWVVRATVPNDECPEREFDRDARHHTCLNLDGRWCDYDTCPSRLPRTQEEAEDEMERRESWAGGR